MSNYNTTLQSNNTDLQSILNAINELPEAGISLPTLTNPAEASKILNGEQAIDSEGNIITGTMPNNGAISATFDGINTKSYTVPSGYTSGGTVSLDNTIDNEVDEQADLITRIKSVVDNLPEAGGSAPVETVTITCIEDGPSWVWQGRCYYVNKNDELCSVNTINIGSSIEVRKNSIIYGSICSRMTGPCDKYDGICFITGNCVVLANV